ncbi:hypothetical protein L3049_17480 [Labilibaculum sp. DW002]|uniref:Lipocalin-like domain-containing protein n=1 Tax=Paralabilibaculum antarcticum TaxID=2912572 RepID=A0ABT5VWH4_9BACT|nr:hypothetical protein [Labilibaculum sp. DW002]MDE5419785.1 hypothetical protein [Labilibaculum sp. DW002]
MKKGFYLIACAILLIACDKSDNEVSNRPLLKEKFNGKYELISSVADKAVDLNNDGIASKNLFSENSTMYFSEIVIQIPQEEDLSLKENEFCFTELWPTGNDHRQNYKEVITTYKTPVDNPFYDLKCNIRIGHFQDDLKFCTLNNDVDEYWEKMPADFKLVEFGEDETIEITVLRNLFTKNGWVTTEIKSLYKRYTIIT